MYIFIVNPTAGSGRSERIYQTISKSDLYQQITSQSYFTEHKGHAEELTKHVLETYGAEITTLIVIGGDGTLFEVVNGLGDHFVPIALIPGGSGNDFARGCSIAKDPLKVLAGIIASEGVLPYWLGEYQVDGLPGRVFTNNFGMGLDARIVRTANESRYKKYLNRLGLGRVSYVFALLYELFNFKPLTLEVVADGKRHVFADCWMVNVTNHPYYGGGMKIMPHAKIQPDVFPVLLIHSISKWKILALFLTVFTGHHTKFSAVKLLEATELTIISPEEVTYQTDGENGECTTATITKRGAPLHVLGTQNKS